MTVLSLSCIFSYLWTLLSVSLVHALVQSEPLSTPRQIISRQVIAHHMVGNTYPYGVAEWTEDIRLASSVGIDAFALNIGRDDWQPDRVKDAFNAASAFEDFKLFISFDMTSLPCGSPNDANTLRFYIEEYADHPNQFTKDGKPFVSTFAGEYCHFGQGSLNDAWSYAIKPGSDILPDVHFTPSFFMDPAQFSTLSVIDGMFNWDSSWPKENADVSFDSDSRYRQNLISKTYMAAVSPWFFTHYGPDTYNKNWIYRMDDWGFAERWELLIDHRRDVDLAQIISWNDYGESHYVGPIKGSLPKSESWTLGFDHQGWLDLIKYYAEAYKSGYYPDVIKDRVFLWSRLYPADADAPDPVGRPRDWEWSDDVLWAVVLLTDTADVTLSCGDYSSTFSDVPSGANKLKLPLKPTCNVRATVNRDGIDTVDFAPPAMVFSSDPSTYNFNVLVAASQ